MTEAVIQNKRGQWYPWIFVAAFAVVVVVNGIMIYLALSTFPGLETQNAYERGVTYNKTLAAMERQKQLGWTGKALFQSPDGLEFTLTDAQGQPLDGFTVRGQLLNPTREGQDVDFTMESQGGGLYRANVAPPAPGQWQVNIYARQGETVFFHPMRFRNQ